MSLNADEFLKDPAFIRAEKSILSCLKKHQSHIVDVKGPDSSCVANYDYTLSRFSELRGNPLWYPYLGSGMGNGPLVELADGSVKYDFINGIGVHIFGHSHSGILQASLRGALGDTVMQGNLQQNCESVELCEQFLKLANQSSAKLSHCFLTSSGAMANENGLKIAFQKHAPANRILAFKRCFMGRTLALTQATDKAAYRVGLPDTLHVDYVPFYDDENPDSIRKSVNVLKHHIKRYPGKHAAMCMELVQGEGGYYPGSSNFFMALIDVLNENKIAVMVDEIQTFGRTSRPFAYQHFGLDSHVDIVSVGKMTQVCATLFKADYNPKPGLISQTFTSSSSAIAAANYTLNTFMETDLFGEAGRNMKLHDYIVNHLEKIRERHPFYISGPYGIGTMIAFTPFSGDVSQAKSLAKRLFENGLICFIAGDNPARIRFLLPAMVLKNSDIDKAMLILKESLEQENE